MALTLDELMRMANQGSAPPTAGGVDGTGGTRQQRGTFNGQQVSFTAPAGRPTAGAGGQERPTSAQRVNRALTAYQSPMQTNRESAEASINDELARDARSSMIQRRAAMKRLREPGSRNVVEQRMLMREAELAGGMAETNLMATGDLRQASTERDIAGLQGATTMAQQELSNQGALDAARLQGRFGLAERQLNNQGLVAQQTAINPIEQLLLDQSKSLLEQAEGMGPEYQARAGTGVINALATKQPIDMSPDQPMGTVLGDDGAERELPQSEALFVNLVRTMRENQNYYGLTDEEIQARARAMVNGDPIPGGTGGGGNGDGGAPDGERPTPRGPLNPRQARQTQTQQITEQQRNMDAARREREEIERTIRRQWNNPGGL